MQSILCARYCTLIVPVIAEPWISQKYGNVPGFVKVKENDCPCPSGSDRKIVPRMPGTPLDTVWRNGSLFNQVTLVPRRIVSVDGT